MATISRLVMELALIDGASAVARGAAQSLQSLGADGERAFQHLSRAVDQFQGGMRGLATARQLKEQLVDPGVEAAASLQDALSGLQVTLDRGSVEQMRQQLADAQADAARVAGPTAFSQEDVVNIQTSLRKAGLELDAILGRGGASEAVAQLATAEPDLGGRGATDAILTMGSIFNLGGDQYADAADLLTRAAGASAVNPGQLAEALSQAPSAGAMALDQQETLASLGVLGNMGIRGGAGGTALNAFLRQAAVSDQKFGLGLFDDQGQFRGLAEAAVTLRQTMEGRSQQEQQVALQKAFGDEGARFALGLLRTGSGSLEDTLAKMQSGTSLQERVDVRAGTLSASRGALEGTGRSLLATLFQPALDPLTQGTRAANEALGEFADRAQSDPRIAQAASYGAMGATGLAGLYGLSRIAQGGFNLSRGLSALGGRGLLGSLMGTGAGIAQGKAVEAATGTQAVFVTNWPAGLGAGGLAGSAAAAAKGGGMATLGRAGAALGAGAAGYAVGSAVNEHLIQGSPMEDLIQAGIAQYSLYTLPGAAALAASGTSRDEARAGRNEALNSFFEKMDINISIDRDGQAEAEVRTPSTSRTVRSWSRVSRM